jgi:hypothetical protein
VVGIFIVVAVGASRALREPEYELIEVFVIMLSTVLHVDPPRSSRESANAKQCLIDASCDLQTVLESRVGRELLEKHLVVEYAAETLHFYEAVSVFFTHLP